MYSGDEGVHGDEARDDWSLSVVHVLRLEGNVGVNGGGVEGVVCALVRSGEREEQGGRVEVVRVGQDLCCVCCG